MTMKDFSSAASSYFGNIRVPASFLLSSSLGAVFTLLGLLKSVPQMSPFEQTLYKLYHIMCLVTFLFAINTVIVATSSVVMILHGDFDPMAETAYELLQREFKYEYVTTRFFFLTALMIFLASVAVRIIISFQLCGNRKEAFAVIFAFLAVIFHIVSYVDSTMYDYESLVEMGIELLKMTIDRMIKQYDIYEIMAGAFAVFSVIFALLARAEQKPNLKKD